jgi:hypothetical protein
MGRPSQLTIGNPLYWSIPIYDEDHFLINADSVPTFTVRRNSGSPSASVNSVANATGLYDCSYLPPEISEGDIFTVKETVIVNGQSYTNTWQFSAQLEEATDEGGGSVLYTLTVQDNLGNIVPSAKVNIRTSDGTPLNVFGITRVDDGSVEFNLDPNTYQFSVTNLNGYELHQPELLVVSEANNTGLIVLTKSDVLTSDTLDLSGIKRVKTKHMEIEAFDPRIMQQARDKENSSLPCFGDSHFCIGKSKYDN